jgi:hypothetical protein
LQALNNSTIILFIDNATTKGNQMFNINQIVKGKRAGTFVVLALRTVGGEQGAQVKEVNPNDHTQTAPGEMFLPFDAIEAIN